MYSDALLNPSALKPNIDVKPLSREQPACKYTTIDIYAFDGDDTSRKLIDVSKGNKREIRNEGR